MTREKAAQLIRWDRLIWVVAVVNVTAMLPQLWSILSTNNVEGLSLSMIGIYLFVQVGLTLDSYFKRNVPMQWCFFVSGLVSVAIIFATLYLRKGGNF